MQGYTEETEIRLLENVGGSYTKSHRKPTQKCNPKCRESNYKMQGKLSPKTKGNFTINGNAEQPNHLNAEPVAGNPLQARKQIRPGPCYSIHEPQQEISITITLSQGNNKKKMKSPETNRSEFSFEGSWTDCPL